MKDNTEFKQSLSKHFDKQALKIGEDRSLADYGSSTNDKFLRSPYVFIEEYISQNDFNNTLDYCCGTGIYSIFPAKNGSNVSGLDISEKSIDSARTRAKLNGVESNCHFKIADAEKIPFQDKSFDLVLSYGSLSYLDMNMAFSEISRVLCDQGTLIVVDSLGHNPFFNLNRRRNIMNYAPNYYQNLKTIKIHKIKSSSKEFFKIDQVQYFDLTSVLGSYISNVFKLNLNPNHFIKIDSLLSQIPILRRYFFKGVFIFTKN